MKKNYWTRLKFWFEWSYYLRCKHCCLFCEHYDMCKLEVDEILRTAGNF